MKNTRMRLKASILEQIEPYSADVLDPFTLQRPFPFKEKIKACVVTVLLLPLRLLVMISLLVFAYLVTVLTLRGLPENERTNQKPLSGWRRWFGKPFVVAINRLIFAVGGWNWIRTKGRRAPASEAPILVLTPHTSFFDTIPIVALGCPCLVVKESTGSVPFFGTLINYTQPVLVKREDATSRHSTKDEILRRCQSGDNWEQILIFPEGTNGNGQALLDYKLGAFYPGVPVQPVFIRYPNKFNTITWTWNGPSALQQWWLTMTQFHIFCELEFLPVYYPTSSERENARLYAENVRLNISKMCKIPLSYFALDDVKYLKIAEDLKLPRTVALVKLLKLRSRIGKTDTKRELSILTLKADGMKEVLASVEGFGKYINAKVCEAMKDFCYTMDQEKQGKIDVRIYNVGLWLLRTDLGEWKRLENGFKIFEPKIGAVTESQFAAIAFLWRGLPLKLASNIFHVLTFDAKDKETIPFKKFKSVAMSYAHLEKKISRVNGEK